MRRIILVLVFILLVGGIIFLFLKLKIKDINCVNQFGNCSSDLVNELKSSQNKSRNIINLYNNLKTTLKDDTNVLQYRIDFELPFNFKVNTIVRSPIVAFSLNSGGFALISSDGDILEKTATTSLPKITSYYNLTKDQLVFVSSLMNSLNKIYNVAAGKVSAEGLEVDNVRNMNVIFPLTGEKETLLGSLNLILSRLPSVKEASTIKTIDLRFKNPVLR